MSNWSEQQFREYSQRRLASESRARERIQRNAKDHTAPVGIPSTEPKPNPWAALVCNPSRKEASGNGSAQRFKVSFIIRCQKPRDWDNNSSIKFLQDRLVDAGILPSDAWDIVQGQIISEKCANVEEEGTVIVIETLD